MYYLYIQNEIKYTQSIFKIDIVSYKLNYKLLYINKRLEAF